MDVTTLAVGAGMLLIGFVLGRMNGRAGRTTTVYEAPRRRSGGSPAGGRELDPEVEACIRAGRKIEAIRRYRKLYGGDLKAAKEAVEAYEARLNR